MVNKTSKHGKQVRKGVTVQLVDGQDNDLIEALENVNGSRQAVLKKWLRESQGFAQAADGSLPLDQSQALDYLVKAAGYLMSRVDQTEAQVASLKAHLEQLSSQPPSLPVRPAAPPPQAGVSQETLDKRKERLNKRGW